MDKLKIKGYISIIEDTWEGESPSELATNLINWSVNCSVEGYTELISNGIEFALITKKDKEIIDSMNIGTDDISICIDPEEDTTNTVIVIPIDPEDIAYM